MPNTASGLGDLEQAIMNHLWDTPAPQADGFTVRDVHETLERLSNNALDAGVKKENIVLDPGLGFAKSPQDNWALLKALPEFLDGEFPILVGASRKSFLATVGSLDGEPIPADERDAATAAVSVVLAQAKVWAIRVHEVRSTRAACDVVAALERAR